MRKLLAILTVLTLIVGLTACSKDNPTDSSSDTIAAVAQTESTDVSEPTTDSSDISSETTENTESNTTSEKTEVKTSETNSKTEASKPSTTTSKQETTNKTETSKPAVSSKEETKNNLYFYNDTVDGRWTADSISVVAKEVYFKNGQLVAHCFIVNGYSTNATSVNIKQIIVLDKNGTQIAHAYFNSQNLSIAALSYIEHTFTFGADTITSTNVDMSVVTINSQFQANH